ncbi:hypothetical protein NDU88_006282 [Pleurodeles waltl]|uniref:Uncharacterized protein n=1 Tax=Pleurodeles waltl TaxID=8319 RepID=A0AAV7WA57_PLEWA|nr:hypothetical protein NDU88_006282 [Pleurodeles waltl]
MNGIGSRAPELRVNAAKSDPPPPILHGGDNRGSQSRPLRLKRAGLTTRLKREKAGELKLRGTRGKALPRKLVVSAPGCRTLTLTTDTESHVVNGASSVYRPVLRPNSSWTSGPSQRQRKCRPQSHKKQPSARIDPPTAEEAQEERQRVVAVVASPGGSPLSTMSLTRWVSGEQMDSDNETTTSAHSSMVLLAVTQRTVDEEGWI